MRKLSTSIRKKIIRLLKEDEEFRYMVAGLTGIEEVLRRLDGIEREQKRLREEIIRLGEEQIKLREDFNKMLKEIERINRRLGRIERTVEKLAIDVEEEARSFIKHHLENAGIHVDA